MPDTLTDRYWRLPPITRTLGTWMFVTSIGVHFGHIPFHWLKYNQFYLRFPPEIWRLATGCLITGGELSILFDTYFFCNAASYLEKNHPRMRRQEDFICFGFQLILLCQGIDYFGSSIPFRTLTHAFIVALTYTATQRQQGLQVNHMFIPIHFHAPLTPYAMIFISLLLGGRAEFILGVYGIVAGHLWEFLTRIYPELGGGSNFLKTPAFMTRLVRFANGDKRQYFSSSGVTGGYTTGATSGSSNGPLPDFWRTKGNGRRLG
ncbi:hypothetical protein PWT90_10199 [Aphanocladium album]|nr:hypothetical protein PWT90_10199 [Aphanocladium album]